ncbi:MAG TPA: amidohydrolase family protein [Chloroflexota bacterium]
MERTTPPPSRLPLAGAIDCDVHAVVPSVETLFPYLPEYWRESIAQSGFKGPVDTPYPPGVPTSVRPDAREPGGPPPGSDLDLLRRHVLDPWSVRYALLNCVYAVESVHNPYAAAALASAVNDWLREAWLRREPRLRASIVVPVQQPDLAAEEIDRVGGDPGFVQVLLPVRSEAPYGNRRYWPIYEAAVRHDLVVGIHFGGAPGNPPTPCGWPSTYLEEFVGMASVFQSQVISLVAEGVFERFPTLRVALLEGGFTWLPSLMWRLDKEWKGLRREVPWVRRLPSEYIREHVRLSLQPLDAPPDPRHLLQIVEQMGSDELLLFATDYPHWHFDAPEEALPAVLPEGLQRKVLVENARAFYRWGDGSA